GIGAHPGYPDLSGFGRRHMACTEEEIRQYMVYQIGAIKGFCKVHGVQLQHVKPHGALYLDAVENKITAQAIARAIMDIDPDLYFVALAGKKGETMRQVGEELGLKVVYEAFPDRAYTPQGTLAPRKNSGAVISNPNEVSQRALDMANGFVTAVDGSTISLEVQTLCVHGDTLGAINLVKNIKQTFKKNNIQVLPMGKII
nr:5-oxoprolinase subunit PxpA [Desulfobacula sp.]